MIFRDCNARTASRLICWRLLTNVAAIHQSVICIQLPVRGILRITNLTALHCLLRHDLVGSAAPAAEFARMRLGVSDVDAAEEEAYRLSLSLSLSLTDFVQPVEANSSNASAEAQLP